MKNYAINLVWVVTAYLVVYTILAQTILQFPAVFALACIGQGLVVYMVYTVLTDKYTTKKKFKHWYEDRPRE